MNEKVSKNLKDLRKKMKNFLATQTTLNFLYDEKRTKHIREYQDELIKTDSLIADLETILTSLKNHRKALNEKVNKSSRVAKNHKLLTEFPHKPPKKDES
jgi:hypothetical protein